MKNTSYCSQFAVHQPTPLLMSLPLLLYLPLFISVVLGR